MGEYKHSRDPNGYMGSCTPDCTGCKAQELDYRRRQEAERATAMEAALRRVLDGLVTHCKTFHAPDGYCPCSTFVAELQGHLGANPSPAPPPETFTPEERELLRHVLVVIQQDYFQAERSAEQTRHSVPSLEAGNRRWAERSKQALGLMRRILERP